MHIDEKVLAEVMGVFGFATKTEAVNTALLELIRKRKLREMMSSGMGLEQGEYAGGLLPGYDPLKLRVAETSGDADGER
ncbi:MAG: type II toxin-antitoxin system VapB family antitoxin [Verrucomicrobiales bacterium]